jgi:hypothetical protein
MANRISILVALEGADEGLTQAIESAGQSLSQLASSAQAAEELAIASATELSAGMNALGEQINHAKTQLLAFLTIDWAAGKVSPAAAWCSLQVAAYRVHRCPTVRSCAPCA